MILDVLAQSFDFVVVDTAKEFDEMLALVSDKRGWFFRYGNGCAVVKECLRRAFRTFRTYGYLSQEDPARFESIRQK